MFAAPGREFGLALGVRRVVRFRSPSTSCGHGSTAVHAAASATVGHGFTPATRLPSDELDHRSYSRLLPESTAAFHRETLP